VEAIHSFDESRQRRCGNQIARGRPHSSVG
jgi:hypothetical protein